jgi:hypothetical protein
MRPLASIALLMLLPSCSVVVKTGTTQCEADADCDALGFLNTTCSADKLCMPKVDPKWGCLGKVMKTVPTGMVHLKYFLHDAVTMQGISTATARVCNQYDPDCTKPLASPPVAKDGAVELDVLGSFVGYLDVTDDNHLEELINIDPASGFSDKNQEILIPAENIVVGVAKTAGVTYDPTKGLYFVRTVNCLEEPAAGVSVSMFPGSGVGFYFADNIASTTASVTDRAANAGFLNVTPGNVTISATLGSDGPEIGHVATFVRAHTATAIGVGPSPLP